MAIKDIEKFVLHSEETDRLRMTVWAEVSKGCLEITGQDFGAEPLEFWGKDEYEYFYTFNKQNTAKLAALLNATSDSFKDTLLERFSGIDGTMLLRRLCEANSIKYKFFSY
ncbi:MAG: hypothetical protein BWY62_01081 [Firmicutes bacterium ADurb.Bin356]|nr:MAG: hypothetical protein BWY62_01081 [Firmicutes bacterium ADurb.Bin356]